MNAAVSLPSPSSGINSVSKPGRLAVDASKDDDEEDEDEDEFFDCRENLDDTSSLAKWSSMELTPQGDPEDFDQTAAVLRAQAGRQQQQQQQQQQLAVAQYPESSVSFRRAQSMRETPTHQQQQQQPRMAASAGRASNNPVIDVAECAEVRLLSLLQYIHVLYVRTMGSCIRYIYLCI